MQHVGEDGRGVQHVVKFVIQNQMLHDRVIVGESKSVAQCGWRLHAWQTQGVVSHQHYCTAPAAMNIQPRQLIGAAHTQTG